MTTTNNDNWFYKKCVELLEDAIFESRIIYPTEELVINIPDYFLKSVVNNFEGNVYQITFEYRFMGIELRIGYENKIIIFHPSCVIKGKSIDNYYEKQIP